MTPTSDATVIPFPRMTVGDTPRSGLDTLRAFWAFADRSPAHALLSLLLRHAPDPDAPILDRRLSAWLRGAAGVDRAASPLRDAERARLAESLKRRIAMLGDALKSEIHENLRLAGDLAVATAMRGRGSIELARETRAQCRRWSLFLAGGAPEPHPIFGEDVAAEMADAMVDASAQCDAGRRLGA